MRIYTAKTKDPQKISPVMGNSKERPKVVRGAYWMLGLPAPGGSAFAPPGPPQARFRKRSSKKPKEACCLRLKINKLTIINQPPIFLLWLRISKQMNQELFKYLTKEKLHQLLRWHLKRLIERKKRKRRLLMIIIHTTKGRSQPRTPLNNFPHHLSIFKPTTKMRELVNNLTKTLPPAMWFTSKRRKQGRLQTKSGD